MLINATTDSLIIESSYCRGKGNIKTNTEEIETHVEKLESLAWEIRDAAHLIKDDATDIADNIRKTY